MANRSPVPVIVEPGALRCPCCGKPLDPEMWTTISFTNVLINEKVREPAVVDEVEMACCGALLRRICYDDGRVKMEAECTHIYDPTVWIGKTVRMRPIWCTHCRKLTLHRREPNGVAGWAWVCHDCGWWVWE